MNHRLSASSAALLGCFVLMWVAPVATTAQQTITAITTSTASAPLARFTNRRHSSCASTTFSSSANFASEFGGANGHDLELTSITVGGRTLTPERTSASVVMRRSPSAPGSVLVFYEPREYSNARSNAYIRVRPGYAATVNDVLSGRVINRGIESVFGGCTQAQRLDYFLPPFRVSSSSDLPKVGLSALDLGAVSGSGDAFRIAAITGLDAAGVPNCYGPLIPVAATDFGTSGVHTLNTNQRVQYNLLAEGDATSRPSAVYEGTMRGVFISLADLGIPAGTTVYGYSLFDTDTGTSNPDACHSDLVDWNTFPSSSSTGLDIAGGAFLMTEAGVTLSPPSEVCGNGVDDDGDGLADGLDLDCCLNVTTTDDSGDGSLRQAITCANYHAGTQTVTFDLQPDDPRYHNPDGIRLNDDDVWEIKLTSGDLPTITDPVVIDGSTQSGSDCDMSTTSTTLIGMGSIQKPAGTRVLVHAQGRADATSSLSATANTQVSHLKLIHWAPDGSLANTRVQATAPATISMSCMELDRD